MQSAKETASNIAASAKSGMEKTKAVAQEKVEKMTTRDPLKKEMAEQKKDARINETERMKHEARAENAAARREHGHPHAHAHDYTATGYTTGTTDLPTGAGYTAEGPVGGDHPAAATRASGRTGIQDPRVTGRNNTGYGSAETY